MAVMAREAWTDERLDDLAKGIDKRFDRVDRQFEEVKGEIRDLRVDVNSRFMAVEARLDGINRSIVISAITMTASIVGALLLT